MSVEEKIKCLTRELKALTEKDGPLVLLVEEVRKSNRLALRNVRLQFMSLAVLIICLLCLILLGFYFHKGLVSLVSSEERVAELTNRFNVTESAVTSVETRLAEAPKIVADDSGQLKVVANVERHEPQIYNVPEKPLKKESKKELKKRMKESARLAEENPETIQEAIPPPEKIEIPLNMKDVLAR